MAALMQDRLKLAESTRMIFSVTPEQGVEFKDMLKPEYWAHVGAKLHPGARIEVLAEDNTWFAELFVVACARNWAKVTTLRFVELAESETPSDPEDLYDTNWGGANARHRVIRKTDKAVIKDGFATKADAKRWILDNESNLI